MKTGHRQRRAQMEEKIALLLDYQRFWKNPGIEEMLRELENRYGEELTEESLSLVSAAGDMWHNERQHCKLMEEQHEE